MNIFLVQTAKVAKVVGGFGFRSGSVILPIITVMAGGILGFLFAIELAKAFVEITVATGRLSRDSLEYALVVFGVYGTTLFVYARYMWFYYRKVKEWLLSSALAQGK